MLLLRSRLSVRRGLVLRTESSRQGYRLTAASLPCPRRSFGTSHKGAEPKLYANRRLVRSQEPLILLNSQKMSVGAECWLASLVIRSEGTYGRGDRRCSEGAAVVEGFRSWQKVPPRRVCERGSITLETLCAAGSTPHAGGSFFLYEKSVLRESNSLRGRKPEVCTDLTPNPFRP